MIYQFTVTYSNGREQVFTLEKDHFTIGRSSKCDVILIEEGFSRQHCLIEVIDGDVYATDLGSANGVLINEEKIPPHQRTKYNLSFSLNLASVEISGFQFLGDSINTDNEIGEKEQPLSPVRSTAVINKRSSPQKAFKADKTSASRSMHPGLRGVLAFLFLIAVMVVYHHFRGETESEHDELSRMLFQANTSKKKADGSIKTRNF